MASFQYCLCHWAVMTENNRFVRGLPALHQDLPSGGGRNSVSWKKINLLPENIPALAQIHIKPPTESCCCSSVLVGWKQTANTGASWYGWGKPSPLGSRAGNRWRLNFSCFQYYYVSSVFWICERSEYMQAFLTSLLCILDIYLLCIKQEINEQITNQLDRKPLSTSFTQQWTAGGRGGKTTHLVEFQFTLN